MTLAPVTHPPLHRRRWPVVAVAMLTSLAGCASGGYSPGRLDAGQFAACRAVAEAFVEGKAEHAELREQLSRDPVAAAWYMRWLESVISKLRDGSYEIEHEGLFKAEEGMRRLRQSGEDWRIGGRRPEAAAIDELAWFGEAAVPIVVADLLSSQQEFQRRIGIEVLVRIGEPAVPALLGEVRSGSVVRQRAAARALGELGAAGAALAALRELARSPEWTVRADVVQSLQKGGTPARDLLVQMLDDEDPFVRKKAAATLGFHADADTVRALADFLVRCQRREDIDSEVAAQTALQAIARTRGPRTVAAWRDFADRMANEPQPGAR